MRIFSKLFKKDLKTSEPQIQFGRFTDTYKSDEKYKSWDIAIDHFENEKYLAAYSHFFDFLTNDGASNVVYKQGSGKISFSIFQGSKIIEGDADFHFFKAEAKIVRTTTLHIGLMRSLLENNFDLKYSRYALDENGCICLKFDTFVEDGSPHKIYQALKELATEADRKDDVLMHEYEGLLPINHHHTRQVSDLEINVKYEYFVRSSKEVIEEVESSKLNPSLYPGGISFLLLDFVYRIDFLIKPEGNIMEKIKEIHDQFFHDNLLTVHDKNKNILKDIKSFETILYKDFAKEIYEVSCTFGSAMPEGHQRLVEIIDAQMTDFEWYYENKHYAYAKAICGYVVGFSLYSFALPEPSKSLLILYYKLTNVDYFKGLGFHYEYRKADGSFNKSKINEAINTIIKDSKQKYGDIIINLKLLNYTDIFLFCRSYLLMLRQLQYPEA